MAADKDVEFGIRILGEYDFDPDNYSDVAWRNRECATKLASGAWSVYWMQVMHRCMSPACDKDGHPTSMSVGGYVVEEASNQEGVYYGTELERITSEYLREEARNLIEEVQTRG